MWGPWGTPLWEFRWIFPLIGMLVCLGFMAVMIWAMMRGGHGLGCMGGHGRHGHEANVDVQREISELKKEIQQLRGGSR